MKAMDRVEPEHEEFTPEADRGCDDYAKDDDFDEAILVQYMIQMRTAEVQAYAEEEGATVGDAAQELSEGMVMLSHKCAKSH